MQHVSKAEFRLSVAVIMIGLASLSSGGLSWLSMIVWTVVALHHLVEFARELWRERETNNRDGGSEPA